MKRGPYKRYLYCSNAKIPRTTLWRKKHARQQEKTTPAHMPGASTWSFSDIEDGEDVLNPEEGYYTFTEGLHDESMTSSIQSVHGNESDKSALTGGTEGYEPIPILPVKDQVSNNKRDINQNQLMRFLDDKLCECTSMKEGDALLMCLSLGFQHSISWPCMIDTLTMIDKLCGAEVAQNSKQFFAKYMEIDKTQVTVHIYCPSCESYLGQKKDLIDNRILECSCGENLQNVENVSNIFISLGLEAQLKDLLRDENFVHNLNWRFERQKQSEDALDDIYDGNLYQKLSSAGEALYEPYNLSYTFNTEGISSGKSSKPSIWPIHMTINELPPHKRTQYMLLVGIYFGRSNPNIKNFLHPFVEEANRLSTTGINWSLDENEINSKVIPLGALLDPIVGRQILNIASADGYGCPMCYQKAEKIDRSWRFTISEKKPDRTHENILMDAAKAFANRNHEDPNRRIVKGVKGSSPLHNLEYFDLADSLVPDYIHSVLVDVIKHHTLLLVNSPEEEYYIGTEYKMNTIDNRLASIRPPRIIAESLQSFQKLNLWEGSEWRSWLISYSILCLNGILPRKYVVHLGMLSAAINILFQKSITPLELGNAQIYLLRYVFLFQKYFGKTAMVYNVHLLTHVKKVVINWGPLWTLNTFSFRGKNKKFLQPQYMSPVRIAKQMDHKLAIFRTLPILCEKYTTSQTTLEFCEGLCGKAWKSSVRNQNLVLIGDGYPYILNAEERACLDSMRINVEEVNSFEQMIHDGIRYTSNSFSRTTKTDDSYMRLKDGTRGRIENICKVNGRDKSNVFIFLRELFVDHEPILTDFSVSFEFQLTHVQRIITDGCLRVIKENEIVGQSGFMCVDEVNFIYDIPYGYFAD